MVELFRSIGVGQWLRYVTGVFEVAGAAFMVIPLASGGSAVALGIIMISATLIELLVLRRPPIAAMACLSAHTYVAWGRLLHRPLGEQPLTPPIIVEQALTPPLMEPVLTPEQTEQVVTPPLVNDHLALHEGMNVAAIRVGAGGVEGPRD
jgi:hypothetical protein